MGLTICEDIWYPGPPASVEARAGASLIVNPSASPYHRGKGSRARGDVRRSGPARPRAAFALCNLVGGQDELVFDGHSVVVAADGRDDRPRRPVRGGAAGLRPPVPRARGSTPEPVGASAARRLDAPRTSPAPSRAAGSPSRLDPDARSTRRSSLGLRDYVRKNGFERVLVALSGGIDSALVALIAADALGAETGQLRGHALPPLERRDPGRRPGDRRATSARS